MTKAVTAKDPAPAGTPALKLTGISKTWNDIAFIIEFFIQGCCKDIDIWMCILKCFHTFWSGYQGNKFNI